MVESQKRKERVEREAREKRVEGVKSVNFDLIRTRKRRMRNVE